MVGVNGENMGVVSYKSALEDAKKDKMGLLCVNGRSDPPVYRLMSRNDIHRKEKADRKKKHAQKPKPTKQITFSVKIHDHDRNTKVSHFVFFSKREQENTSNAQARKIDRFLQKGHPVQVCVNYRRPVNLNNPERTPEQIFSDNMVVEEARVLLEEVKAIFEFGKPAGTVSTGPRTMKEMMNPVKQTNPSETD